MPQLIYVRELHFPDGLLQPVLAEQAHGNCDQVLESSDDPEHDVWEFEQDSIVRCESIKFAEGEYGLLAVEKCCC